MREAKAMAIKTTKKSGGETLPQSDVVAIAAFLLGADTKRIDIEDIAVKAHELAPGIFTWKKYKDQIDRELIYKHLWDLTKPDKGEYIAGAKNDGWMLTLAGTSFARKAVAKLKGLSPALKRKKEEPWVKRERARMLGEPAHLKARTGGLSEITVGEAERFFRLDDYVVGEARERKIGQAENAFHDDPDLGSTIAKSAELVRSKK
jgi:hypothetical protein